MRASVSRYVARNIGVIAHRTSALLPRTFAAGAFDSTCPISKGRFFLTSSSAPPMSDPCCESCKNVATKLHYHKVQKDDHGDFEEFSVIFTNRSLNLMSKPFQQVMRDLNDLLKTTYNAEKVAIIPG